MNSNTVVGYKESEEDKAYWDNFFVRLEEYSNTHTSSPMPRTPWLIKQIGRFIVWAFDHVYAHLPRKVIAHMVKKGENLANKVYALEHVILNMMGPEEVDIQKGDESKYLFIEEEYKNEHSLAHEGWRWIEIEKILGKRINPMTYLDIVSFIRRECSNTSDYAQSKFHKSRMFSFISWYFYVPYEKMLFALLWLKGYKRKTVPIFYMSK